MKNPGRDPFFEMVYRLRISTGDGPDGRTYSSAGLIILMRHDEEFYELERSLVEHHWRTAGWRETEDWIRLLLNTARYLSDLVGGDVPVLAPREVIDASIGVPGPGDKEALLIGKSIGRAIRSQVREAADSNTESLLAEFERLLDGVVNNAAPAHSKWLTTEQVAARLGLNRATIERKFRSGEIDGDKTAGNQWRTTEQRLRNSSYLNKKGRGSRDA